MTTFGYWLIGYFSKIFYKKINIKKNLDIFIKRFVNKIYTKYILYIFFCIKKINYKII